MTLHLVRRAAALRRAEWPGSDRTRPLSRGGHRQARRLADLLDGVPVTRLISSPSLRCRQTLEPLAARRGLPLETDARLAEGCGVPAGLELLESLGEEAAVLCSHEDLIPGLIQRLCAERESLRGDLPCEKGSVWVLDGSGAALESASYLPPPAKRRQRDAPRTVEVAEVVDGPEPQLEPEKLRVAVLDLGSTSFHLLVADATPAGEIRRVLRERGMLRLGAMIASEGEIPERVCVRAVEEARRLRRHADDADASQLLVVATAALRDGANGEALARRIGEALGTEVRVLTGEQEAGLIFAAFRRRVALPPGTHLGLDLGGGSLELAVGDDDDVHWEASLPLGVARLHGEFVRCDPMTSKQRRAIRSRVRKLVAPHAAGIERRGPGVCVATGGTVGALARLIATRRTRWPTRSVGQLFVPADELHDLTAELVASTHDQRLRMPGIQKPRADLLPAGAVILESTAAELGLDGFTVSDWGLREGVILESLGLVPALGERATR